MSQKELCSKVEALTGLKVDEPYMSAIINGKRSPLKIMDAIIDILYEENEATEAALQEIRLP